MYLQQLDVRMLLPCTLCLIVHQLRLMTVSMSGTISLHQLYQAGLLESCPG